MPLTKPVIERTTRKPLLLKLVFTMASAFVGGDFADSLNDMKNAQWSTRDEAHARSEIRLGELLKHAAENVPFYRELYQHRGITPDELHTVTDLQALPIFKKSDYRKTEPETLCASNVEPSLRIERTTSGSTGEPFRFALDRRTLPIIFASHLFYDSWHGLQPFDRYVRVVSPPAAPPPLPSDAPAGVRLRRAITNRLQTLYESWTQEKISLWEVDGARAESIWRRIEAFQPEFLLGYTSSLAAIADELLQRNLRLQKPVRGVITIAETLTPNRKQLIEEYFNAPIINRYGLREFGSWSAQSCPESPDKFHINTELVVCEILRPNGTPCAPGETGRVVLTDLRNFARPFIRYDTGDLAVATSETCSCGRGFPLLGPIQGRSLECLRTPSGREISPVVLGHFLFVYRDHSEAVRHYQLVQQSDSRATLLIVPGELWDEQRGVQLESDLRQLVGEDMEVSVETVGEIPPEKSGKRPIIKRASDAREVPVDSTSI